MNLNRSQKVVLSRVTAVRPSKRKPRGTKFVRHQRCSMQPTVKLKKYSATTTSISLRTPNSSVENTAPLFAQFLLKHDSVSSVAQRLQVSAPVFAALKPLLKLWRPSAAKSETQRALLQPSWDVRGNISQGRSRLSSTGRKDGQTDRQAG
jgi:hypothetical protein